MKSCAFSLIGQICRDLQGTAIHVPKDCSLSSEGATSSLGNPLTRRLAPQPLSGSGTGCSRRAAELRGLVRALTRVPRRLREMLPGLLCVRAELCRIERALQGVFLPLALKSQSLRVTYVSPKIELSSPLPPPTYHKRHFSSFISQIFTPLYLPSCNNN